MTDPSRDRLRGIVLAQVIAAAGVLVVGAALAAATLARKDVRLAGTNAVQPDAEVAQLRRGTEACQTNVLVPKDSAGVVLAVDAHGRIGPRLRLALEGPGHAVRRASIGPGPYRDGRAVVSFEQVRRTATGIRLCLRVSDGRLGLLGQPSPGADNESELLVDGVAQPADLSLRFVREGKESLFQIAPAVFHRASLLRPGWVGGWTYYLLAAVAALLVVAAAAILVAYGRGDVPMRWGVLVVAGLAFANAVTWSLVTPAFQPPDEPGHYAYVESLAQRGERPARSVPGGEGSYTREETVVVQHAVTGVAGNGEGRPPWTRAEEDAWAAAQAALGEDPRSLGGGYTTAAGYSPTYYGLEVVPYAAAGEASPFTRLWLMRLLSALMAAGSVAFTFLFARELFPSVAWAGAVAGLAVAFQPMFAFIGGAVNNDNLLILFASAELYLLARILRRGLDVKLAAVMGGVLAAGIVVKPNMYALVPAALAVLGWVTWRDRLPRRNAARFVGAAAGAFAGLTALRYGLLSSDTPTAATFDQLTGGGFQVREFLSYTWQWYLPELPFMEARFGWPPPVWDNYFKGFWGNFGHLDFRLPGNTYRLLFAATLAAVALIGVSVYRARDRAKEVLPRLALGALAVAGIALLVNARSYLALLQGAFFAQGRYLLLAIPVFGAAVAAAALAFGRRKGIVAGTAVVVGIGLLNLLALGVSLGRYYT